MQDLMDGVIPRQAKYTIIALGRWPQWIRSPAVHELSAHVDQPDGRDIHPQHQNVQAGGFVQLAAFEIKAIAFPIAVPEFNRTPLTPTVPRETIRG